MPPDPKPTVRLKPKSAARQEFMPLMRELVRTYQAFAAYDAMGYKDVDLTVAQADVLFTLGNTDGLTCKEIGDKTLITKGTLTGVLDRLAAKDLLARRACSEDRRATRIHLTAQGKQVFDREFPRQIAHLKRRFDGLDGEEMAQAEAALRKIRSLF